MKKFTINAVAAAVATFVSVGAYAAVDIDLTTPAPVVFANEIVATSAAPVTLLNPANGLDITTKVGYSLSNGEVRYVRVELANGTFTTATATTAAVNATIGAVNGIGTSVIYFSITAGSAGISGTTDSIVIAGTRNITSTAANMTVSYSVYDQPSQAQAGGATGRIVNKENKAYVNFAKSYQVAVTADSAIADVEATTPFALFKSGQTSGVTTRARLASIDYKLATTVPKLAAGTPIALTDLMDATATGTKLVITGDFSAAANSDGTYTGSALNRVYLSLAADTACATATVPANALTSTTATFNVGATATTLNPNLCFAPRTGVAIPAATYTADLNAVSAAPATYAVANTASGTVSTITRNGTELQAPLYQTTSGYISRFVLTNTGSVVANYSATVKAEADNTVTNGTLTGSIPAGGMVVIPASDIATFSGLPRGMVTFSVARPNSQIQGVFQIVNATTGSLSNTVMVRPGTN